MVEPTEADAQQRRNACAEAGYMPVPAEAATVAVNPAKAGGYCRGCH